MLTIRGDSEALLVKGVDFILSKVRPAPVVVGSPDLIYESDNTDQAHPYIFPVCVATRGQSKKYWPDLSGSFLVAEQSPDAVVLGSSSQPAFTRVNEMSFSSSPEVVKLSTTR